MSELTYSEYWTEIQSIADNLVSEAMEACDNDREAAEESIQDTRLHETIDGHQWVIYCAYNLDVLKHSDNESYFEDNIGGADHILKDGGIDQLHTVMAFYAMYADVQEKLSDAFDEYEEKLEAA